MQAEYEDRGQAFTRRKRYKRADKKRGCKSRKKVKKDIGYMKTGSMNSPEPGIEAVQQRYKGAEKPGKCVGGAECSPPA